MNNANIFNLLFQKKLQFLFLFYIVLLLPVLSLLAENITIVDSLTLIVVNCILFISISLLLLFVKPKWEKLVYALLFIVAYLPESIYISYLLFAHVLLQGNSVISLFETNPEESKEFLAHYFNPWIIVGFLLYIFFCFFVILKMRRVEPIKIRFHKKLFISTLSVFLLVTVIPVFSKSVYFVDFYSLFVHYKIRLHDEEKAIRERQNITYSVESINGEKPKTIVFVIGESLTRTHMSLYGYKRQTNPLLTSLGDSLIVYKDVLSPQVHTIPVLRSLMSMSNEENPENLVEKPSLIELFNRANYDTFFISTQPFGGTYKTSYDALLNLAQHKYDLSIEKQPDEIILPRFKKILEADSQGKNKLIVIHLIGNHMAYEFRYTPSYNRFNNSKDSLYVETSFRDKKAITMIDKYDNSVLYNDRLIYDIIKSLQNNSKTESAMIYISDHGEEIYDIRNFAGHAYEKVSTYMAEIPFLVWLSPDYKKNRVDLNFDPQIPYSTQDIIYSISDLANLKYQDYDDTKSVFSKQFKPKERLIGTLTYDEVKELESKYKH